MIARRGGGCRSFAMSDSRVAKGSHAKGRSFALALRPSLMKTAAIQVAFGIYMSYGFAPTKLNIADCPTRDLELHPTDRLSIDFLSQERLAQVHSYGFSAVFARWTSFCSFHALKSLHPLQFHLSQIGLILHLLGALSFGFGFGLALPLLSGAFSFGDSGRVFPPSNLPHAGEAPSFSMLSSPSLSSLPHLAR